MSKSGGQPNTAARCADLARPVAESLGLLIWDVRFEKEGGSYFLRYFIDKAEGVTIEDCEKFSRAVDKLLDEADPIDQSYCLEVSSPGTERSLRLPAHYESFIGRKITVKLFSAKDGRREFAGTLAAFDKENKVVTLSCAEGESYEFGLSEISAAKQYTQYNFKGED